MTPFASVAMLEKFTQRLFAPDLVADIQATDDVVVAKGRIVDFRGHVLRLRPRCRRSTTFCRASVKREIVQSSAA
jgi:hypothetical protein